MTKLRVVRGPSGLMDCVESDDGHWMDCRGEEMAKLMVEAVNFWLEPKGNRDTPVPTGQTARQTDEYSNA
jgi:hypothetical protein